MFTFPVYDLTTDDSEKPVGRSDASEDSGSDEDMPLRGAPQGQLSIDNHASAEAIREFTEHLARFKRPLVVKTEFDQREDERLTNEIRERKERELKAPVMIDSFYGRYDGLTIKSHIKLPIKSIKCEEQRLTEKDFLKQLADPSFNPLSINEEQAVLLKDDLWKAGRQRELVPVPLDLLWWSKELVKRALFLNFQQTEAGTILLGTLNKQPTGKQEVMLHMDDFSLWLTGDFTDGCTFVRYDPLAYKEERAKLIREAKINARMFYNLVDTYLAFCKETIETPFVYGDAILAHIEYVAKKLYHTNSKESPRYNLSILLPPASAPALVDKPRSALEEEKAFKKPEEPMLGKKRLPQTSLPSATSVTLEADVPILGTASVTATPSTLLTSVPPAPTSPSSPTLQASPTVEDPPPTTMTSTEEPQATSSPQAPPETAPTETTIIAAADAANTSAADGDPKPEPPPKSTEDSHMDDVEEPGDAKDSDQEEGEAE